LYILYKARKRKAGGGEREINDLEKLDLSLQGEENTKE
jgi:hypothetical protein